MNSICCWTWASLETIAHLEIHQNPLPITWNHINHKDKIWQLHICRTLKKHHQSPETKKKINTLCFSAVSIPPSIKTPLSYLSLPLPSFTLTTIAFALLSLRFWFWVCFFNLYFPPFQFCSWCWACHGNWREVTVNSDNPLVKSLKLEEFEEKGVYRFVVDDGEPIWQPSRAHARGVVFCSRDFRCGSRDEAQSWHIPRLDRRRTSHSRRWTLQVCFLLLLLILFVFDLSVFFFLWRFGVFFFGCCPYVIAKSYLCVLCGVMCLEVSFWWISKLSYAC